MSGYDTAQVYYKQAYTNSEAYPSVGLGPSSSTREFPESSSRIRDKVGELEALTEVIQSQLVALEKRLDTVLSPQAPQVSAVEKVGTIPTAGSHFYERIASLGQMLISVSNHVCSIGKRIEV